MWWTVLDRHCKKNLLYASPQQEFCTWRTPYFKSLFSNSTEVLVFLKMSKKQNNYKFQFPPQLRSIQRIFFTIFWQKYWSQGNQFLPSILHQYYLEILFYKFFLTQKNALSFLYTRFWKALLVSTFQFFGKRLLGVEGLMIIMSIMLFARDVKSAKFA